MHRPYAARRAAPGLIWLWRSLAIALGYVLLGRLAVSQPGPAHVVSAIWPAAGLALAVLVRWGPGCAPALLLGAWWAERWAGIGSGPALLVALGDVGAPMVASWWMLRAGFDLRLTHRRDLWLLLGAGAFGSSVLGAANGATWLTVFGVLPAVDLPIQALRWWLTDSLGLVVAGVPLLILDGPGLARLFRASQRVRNALLLGGCAAALVVAFALPPASAPASLALLLLTYPLIGALSLRSGLLPASAAVLLLASAMLGGTAAGWGPLAALAGPGAAWLFWMQVASLVGMVLIVHAQVGEARRLSERWELALAGADLGVADWNLRTGEGFTSARWRTLMTDGDDDAPDLSRWLRRVHADDRQALEEALATGKLAAGAGLRRELRVRVGDAWQWFEAHLVVAEIDAAGAPMRVITSLADIGPRRSAEERQKLSGNVFLHLHEGLAVTDADLRVIDANPSYCHIVGLPRGELIGTVPSLLRPPAGDGPGWPQQASLWAALQASGHWVGEVTARRHGGETCALHVTVSTVNGPDGALRYHVLVVSDVTEQRLQHERLERQAHFDELTRLPNRARLGQLLAEAMTATERDGYLLAVCHLDLDHFKAVNERHGREAGDRLLAELADRLRSALRVRGAAWTDAAARLGGDEFVLLLRAGTVDEARAAVERVLRVVAQPILLPLGNEPEIITASVGATVFPLDASDADTLLRHADQAMYGVKQSGRNGYLFFDPELSRRTEERVLAIGRVQDALDGGELVLYYQPKVDLRRGVVLGVEALLRWQHPEHGVIAPAQFLPLIEHTGLSARVGDHVLAQALDQLDDWQRQGLDLSVSVNITGRHLQQPDFSQRLGELLARHGQALGPRLELEVLETAALTDIDFTSEVLERCARLGVRWALDDFGTGYSTLTYLKRLPVHVLKIDRSFVHNMLIDAQDRGIVEGVISLSRTFGCTVVAEGVESPAQARLLLDMGCDVGQGTGIAAPMPAADVASWVREWKGLFALTAAPATGGTDRSAGDAPPAVIA